MNRTRTIATSGIVAGSVALAAALLSSGGVGASFVDAAEASASISVADHLDGLEPSPCTFTLYLDGKEVDLGNGQLPFDLSPFATDSGGGFTATLDFDVSSPDPQASPDAQASDTQWTVTPTGDLTTHTASNPHGISVTFWWPKPSKDHHVAGSVFITLTCTPRSDHAGDHGDDPDHTDGMARVNSIGSVDADAAESAETYGLEAVIDLPADQSEPSCDSQDPAVPDDCTTGDRTPSDGTTQPDSAVQPGDQTQPDDTTTSEGSTQSVDSGPIDAIDLHETPAPGPSS